MSPVTFVRKHIVRHWRGGSLVGLVVCTRACGGTVQEPPPCSTGVAEERVSVAAVSNLGKPLKIDFVARSATAQRLGSDCITRPCTIGVTVSGTSDACIEFNAGSRSPFRNEPHRWISIDVGRPNSVGVYRLRPDPNVDADDFQAFVSICQLEPNTDLVRAGQCARPVSGSVRLLDVDPPRRVRGTYDLTFPEGERVIGSFDTSFCTSTCIDERLAAAR